MEIYYLHLQRVLTKLFGKEITDLDLVTNRIKTFEDAYNELYILIALNGVRA